MVGFVVFILHKEGPLRPLFCSLNHSYLLFFVFIRDSGSLFKWLIKKNLVDSVLSQLRRSSICLMFIVLKTDEPPSKCLWGIVLPVNRFTPSYTPTNPVSLFLPFPSTWRYEVEFSISFPPPPTPPFRACSFTPPSSSFMFSSSLEKKSIGRDLVRERLNSTTPSTSVYGRSGVSREVHWVSEWKGGYSPSGRPCVVGLLYSLVLSLYVIS